MNEFEPIGPGEIGPLTLIVRVNPERGDDGKVLRSSYPARGVNVIFTEEAA